MLDGNLNAIQIFRKKKEEIIPPKIEKETVNIKETICKVQKNVYLTIKDDMKWIEDTINELKIKRAKIKKIFKRGLW